MKFFALLLPLSFSINTFASGRTGTYSCEIQTAGPNPEDNRILAGKTLTATEIARLKDIVSKTDVEQVVPVATVGETRYSVVFTPWGLRLVIAKDGNVVTATGADMRVGYSFSQSDKGHPVKTQFACLEHMEE